MRAKLNAEHTMKNYLNILARLAALAPVAALFFVSPEADSTPPPPPCNAAASLPAMYPDHSLSPLESLRHHDAVFLGEVAVPSRPCSLGYCAGLKLVRRIKGQDIATGNLIQVRRPADGDCAPNYFTRKGEQWIVFANTGTSRTGLRYLYAEDDGPSFIASQVPDFNALESNYRDLRARLDKALESHLGQSRLR